jgi:uncharacterized protein
MLVIELSRIPPEGLEVNETLGPDDVHVVGEESFTLAPGGSLRCRLERVEGNTVHVRGHLRARLGLECGRCLETFPFPVDQELDLFYLPHWADAAPEDEDEVELSDREMVVAYYDGERLDLGEVIRDQFFLAIPMKRLCGEACRGRCPSCGINRNAQSCGCVPPEEAFDLRLTGLKKILDDTH